MNTVIDIGLDEEAINSVGIDPMDAVPGLMRRIQNREQAAMAELYLLCHARVLRQLLYLTKNEAVAMDIAQDVFLRIWRYARAYQPEKSSNAMAWINKVARNQVFSYHALRKRRGECCDDELQDHAAESDEQEQEAQLITNSPAFKAALNTLTPCVKKVIMLRFYGEKSVVDIAFEMGVPVGTVKSWLHRGLARMKDSL